MVTGNMNPKLNGEQADAVALFLPKAMDIRISDSLYLINGDLDHVFKTFMDELYTKTTSQTGKVIFIIFYNIADDRSRLKHLMTEYFKLK